MSEAQDRKLWWKAGGEEQEEALGGECFSSQGGAGLDLPKTAASIMSTKL